MLFLSIILLWASPAPAAIETRLLECAKALARAHEWVVPMSGYQGIYANQFDKDREQMRFWSKKNPRQLFFYAADGLYVAVAPTPVIRPRMVNWNYFVVSGVPGGEHYLRYNASGASREIRAYSLNEPAAKKSFSDTMVHARRASTEEEKEALGLYLESMGYLWRMRESVKNPSWLSYISNAGKGTTPPSAEEVKEMENACAVFFSPDSELNCRK